MGNAVRLAAVEAKERLLELAAQKLEANPRDLEVSYPDVRVKGSPQQSVPIRRLFLPGPHGQLNQGFVLGRGFYTPQVELPAPETGQTKRASAFWSYDAQTVELTVDEETGEVTLLKVCSANDGGRVINPDSSHAQIQGCLAFGIGCTLLEELATKEGKVLNPSFMDYLIPTSLDMPPMVSRLIESAPHREGPFGAKGIAEGAGSPTAAAIANAIYDAVGVRIKDGLITPEKVWAALKRARC